MLIPVLSKEFLVHFWGDQSILVERIGSRTKRLGLIETDILSLCNGEHTVREIAGIISSNYKASYAHCLAIVSKFIEVYQQSGLLMMKSTRTRTQGLFYGSRGKFYPELIVVELTTRCNLKCIHCYNSCVSHGYDMSRRCIEQILALEGKVPELRLTGGEPLLYANLGAVSDRLKGRFLTSIVTNGTLIENNTQALKCFDEVQVSLFSEKPSVHDNMTGCRGSWVRTIRGIRLLVQHGIRTKVNVPMVNCFAQDRKQIRQLCAKLGVAEVVFSSLQHVGRAASLEAGISTVSELSKSDREHRLSRLHCGAGDLSFVVSPTGKVRPCQFTGSEFEQGDFLSEAFREFLFESKYALPLDECINQYVFSHGREGISRLCHAFQQRWVELNEQSGSSSSVALT